MAYVGTTIPIPLGQKGLQTDDPQGQIPANAAIKANNIALHSSRVEKSGGSARYQSKPLGNPIMGLFDWWPTPTDQRLIAITANGQVFRDTGNGYWGGASTTDPAVALTITDGISVGVGVTPDVQMVAGGAETGGRNRKLFIFTGKKAPYLIEQDTVSVRPFATPAADWIAPNNIYPTFGIIYQSRLVVLAGHRIYISALGDHEDFTGGADPNITNSGFQQYPIFAGEGDGLISAVVHKGLLLLFKRPFGVYLFDWRDTTAAPSISKFSDSFGAASPHAFVNMLNDLVGGSNSGTLNSLEATAAHGALEAGDILSNTHTRNYMRDELHPAGYPYMHAIYYPEKQRAYFTGRNSVTSPQNRMIVLDVSRESPRVTLETKDQPNCLALRRDQNNILRPIYGANDGYVYLMDQAVRAVGGAAFEGEFQIPYTDFSYADGSLAAKTKIFDFLTITYQATGTWPFYVDVYVDGDFVETLAYRQNPGAVLDNFILDSSRLGGVVTRSQKNRLHCAGKTLSIRIYNNSLNEFFRVEGCLISFRIGGDQNRSSKTKG